jgi:hypothetical protein
VPVGFASVTGCVGSSFEVCSSGRSISKSLLIVLLGPFHGGRGESFW